MNAVRFLRPVFRFAVHVTLSALGFILVGIVALIPAYGVGALAWLLGTGEPLTGVFGLLEWFVLYVDIFLYAVTVLLWAFVFLVEQYRACRAALGW